MGLDALLARLERRAVTVVTAVEMPAVTRKSAQLVPCTAVTAVTAQNDIEASEAIREPFDREAWEERAAISEFDGGLSRKEAEALAWKEDNRRRAKARSEAKQQREARPGTLAGMMQRFGIGPEEW